MPPNHLVLESWTWPWPIWTLHAAYLLSGLLIAVHYVPQLRRAWQFPAATLAAQSLSTWSVWTLCRAVAFTYGVFVLHDLVFLFVVGADMLGRLAMVVSILRAHAISSGGTPIDRRTQQPGALVEAGVGAGKHLQADMHRWTTRLTRHAGGMRKCPA